jgi:hypothetical protein
MNGNFVTETVEIEAKGSNVSCHFTKRWEKTHYTVKPYFTSWKVSKNQ